VTSHDSDAKLVQAVCEAMQAGRDGEEALMALFQPDGVLVEPFSGQPRTHTGHAAIRAAFIEMANQPRPPDFRLHVDRVDRDGDRVRAEWRCTSAVLPAPMCGCDFYTIRDGKIARLEVTITRMPAPPDGG
jgi:ketosteroid isomerase-like protein